MPQPFNYSFLDVNAAITGPGGSFSLSPGAGNAKEGLSIAYSQDRDSMSIGADGSGLHSLRADKSGKVTVRLLKNSPANALLSALHDAQAVSASLWGQNTITITNRVSGDLGDCQQCAFVRKPDVSYAEDADVIVWEFNAVSINMGFGAGTQ